MLNIFMSNLIYKEPCVECGSAKYGNPIYLDGEGPLCSIDCRRNYFVRQEVNPSFSFEDNLLRGLIPEDLPDGFIIETGVGARLKIKTLSRGNDLEANILRDASQPTSF